MEWLLLLVLPVVLLMVAVQLLPLAYLPDALSRAKADWARMPPAARALAFLSAVAGVTLGWVLRSGRGGQWLAYVLLAFLAMPVVFSLVLPFKVWRDRRRSRRSTTGSREDRGGAPTRNSG